MVFGQVRFGWGDRHVEANRVVEFTFRSETSSYDDPFNDVQLDAVFRTPEGKTLTVPAFWDGGQTWRLRYSSGQLGVHKFHTICSDAKNPQLHNATGSFEIRPYQGRNRLYQHGPIRIAAGRRHFEHADGTPFFWLGDTWWMGLCKRLHWPDEFATLASDRKQKGFNLIQIVVGLYPDMPEFDDRGANEEGFPWEEDHSRVRPAYFQKADQRLQFLADEGFVPCMVGAWGYHMPWLGLEKMKKHWHYLIARYGALPAVWCVAGETTMPYYRSKDVDADREMQKRTWTEVAAYIQKTDPFDRPLTLHGAWRVTSRESVTDTSVTDFDLLQTGHGGRDVVAVTMEQARRAYRQEPTIPVINGEPAYEHLEGRDNADACRMMFWGCMLEGTAGHTYGANGIWQLNRPEQPYGDSPRIGGGHNWGTIPWPEAMRLPGSTYVGIGAKLLRKFPWHRFGPHPEWASWEDPPKHKGEAPYAAGIPGELRVIYSVDPKTLVVHDLKAGQRYRATHFDPVTGQRNKLGPVQGDANRQWRCPAPSTDHDWVLILERI